MVDRLPVTIQRFAALRPGAALVLVCMLSLAGLGPSYAAPTHAKITVDGQPCGQLCKAYLAWSDRVRAASRALFQPRVPQRVAVHHKKPDRPARRAVATHRAGTDAFAQFVHHGNPVAPAAPT